MLGCNTFVHGKLQICRCWVPSKCDQTNFQNSQNWDLVKARAHISRFWKKWSKQQYMTSENLKFLNNLENWPLASSRARVLLFFVTLFCQELMIFRSKIELSCRREPNSQDIEQNEVSKYILFEYWKLTSRLHESSIFLVSRNILFVKNQWNLGVRGLLEVPPGSIWTGLGSHKAFGDAKVFSAAPWGPSWRPKTLKKHWKNKDFRKHAKN